MKGKSVISIKAAFSAAENYCKNNGLSVHKLKSQNVYNMGDTVIFARPVPNDAKMVKRDGLLNDKATQPKPALIVRHLGVEYLVEKTEYTVQYLK